MEIYLIFLVISWIIYFLFFDKEDDELTEEEAKELYYYIEHWDEIQEKYRWL